MATRRSYLDYLPMTDEELAGVDPVEMNLLVAKSIPFLANIHIHCYQDLVNEWAEGVRARLRHAEEVFADTPHHWKNDIRFLRLVVLGTYLDETVGLTYREDQRDLDRIKYTNPSDLFLCGILETGKGTCGNMAMVHVAVAWRLGWPVSLACAHSHFLVRYDDGEVTHNIEATETGRGGISEAIWKETPRNQANWSGFLGYLNSG